MKLIIGLGNLGERYCFTRHNMGFLVLGELADEHGISMRRKKFDADMGEGAIAGKASVLARPRTFMNLSGVAAGQLVSFFKVELNDVIVIHDDLDLVFGSVRVKEGGGHGGHKGLISVMDHLGGGAFTRVRMGIGKPPLKEMVEDYVLSLFNREEMEKLPEILLRGAGAVTEILASGVQSSMNRFNVRRPKEEDKEKESGPCSS